MINCDCEARKARAANQNCLFLGVVLMKQLRNYTEDAVRVYVNKWFPESDICQCDNCRLDIMAIMLNNMKSFYVVTDKGALFAQMSDFDPQYKVDLMTNMSLAVDVVKKHPRHESI